MSAPHQAPSYTLRCPRVGDSSLLIPGPTTGQGRASSAEKIKINLADTELS
jgi:hypothetical protein